MWRMGHGPTEDQRVKEWAPIFLQFLACVAQLIRDFPCSFEFNSEFLVMLHRVSTWGVYGTFVSNEPRERSDLLVEESTFPVWEYFLDSETKHTVRSEFINPLYDPGILSLCLWDTHFSRMSLWNDCYCWPRDVYRPQQLSSSVQIRARVEAIASSEVAALKAQVALLQQQLALLTEKEPAVGDLAKELAVEKQKSADLRKKLKEECVASAVDLVLGKLFFWAYIYFLFIIIIFFFFFFFFFL